MFAFGEAGQAIGPDYGDQEALLGPVFATVDMPLAGRMMARFLPAGP